MPRVVRNIYGASLSRTTLRIPAVDSQAIYMGSFVSFVKNTDAAPLGVEYGVEAHGDDGIIGGIVVGMHRPAGILPLWRDSDKAGTVTDQTGELPVKYTFASTNDDSNGATAVRETVEVYPIMSGDIIDVALWGASTISVARGTTTAFGTTGSSANIGVGMSVNTTYPFALLESTASNTLANLDFITCRVDDQYPSSANHVYVMPVRSFSQFKNVQ